MATTHDQNAAAADHSETAKLIRKLRWIGLDDEARCLQAALDALPPEDRGIVLADPPNTD